MWSASLSSLTIYLIKYYADRMPIASGRMKQYLDSLLGRILINLSLTRPLDLYRRKSSDLTLRYVFYSAICSFMGTVFILMSISDDRNIVTFLVGSTALVVIVIEIIVYTRFVMTFRKL